MRRAASRFASAGFGPRLAVIVAAGLAVRLIYVLALTPDLRGTGDSSFFNSLGDLVAHGRGFIDPFGLALDGRVTPTALHPPLFPLGLAAATKLGASSYLAHRVLVALIGGGALVAMGFLGRRVGGERVGLVAAALAAGYPVLIGADGAVMSETLYGLLILLTLLTAYRAGEHPSLGWSVALGLAIGLTALTRAEALLMLFLIALPLLARTRRGWGRRFGAAVVACAVVLAPWTLRNWITFDRPVLISTNYGTLLRGANCPATYRGRDIGYWVFRCVPPSPSENEAATARSYGDGGIDYATAHAGRLPVVILVRLLRTADLYQPRRLAGEAEGRAARLEEAGAVAFYVLAPLAMYGALLLRRRGQSLLMLTAPVVLAVLVTVVGYGLPRFRHPAEITVVVLAAVALEAIGGRLSRRRLLRSPPAAPQRAPRVPARQGPRPARPARVAAPPPA